jgi:hypothetical protein
MKYRVILELSSIDQPDWLVDFIQGSLCTTEGEELLTFSYEELDADENSSI